MEPNLGKILIIDDNEDVLQAARLFLKKHAAVIHTEKNPQMIPALLGHERYDLILLDMNFTRDVTSGKEGFHWLRQIQEIDPTVVVILITAYGDVEMAVRAMKEGATDFVLKPWKNEKLLATLMSAMALRRSRMEVDRLKSREKQMAEDMDQPFSDFIGQSPAMQAVFRTIQKVAGTDANVLILGENGTGKELVARALHRQSSRNGGPFVSVDMGAISETLFESELFGHMKGAFTDAREDRAGRFEVAHGGTLFLDEIGNLPLPLQAKLLTVLERRQVIRLGSNRPLPIDIRLVTATNMPIHDVVADGNFREDLLYRINTVEVHLPPLRQRGEDILLLADHFLKQYCKKYHMPSKSFNAAAREKLFTYVWPGNVRELQHAVERAVIMSESATLSPADILLSTPKRKGNDLPMDAYNLEEIEKLAIQRTVQKHQGNISKAAKELGLTRTSLYRRLEKYGL